MQRGREGEYNTFNYDKLPYTVGIDSVRIAKLRNLCISMLELMAAHQRNLKQKGLEEAGGALLFTSTSNDKAGLIGKQKKEKQRTDSVLGMCVQCKFK